MMKNKYLFLLLLIFMSFSLVACGSVEETPGETDIPIIGNQGDANKNNPDNKEPNEENPDKNNPDNNSDNKEPNEENPDQKDPNNDTTIKVNTEVEFVVSLYYNKKIYIPEETITVYWVNDYSQYSQEIDSEGYAKKILDGDFSVYLSNVPDDYTYNPNIYTVSSDSPTVQIELLKISKISKGKGTKLYKEYEISNSGAYRSTISKKDKKVYYEFQPKTSGYYVIESIVNIYEDFINPKIDTYNGTTAAKYLNDYDESIDEGGKSKKGGYTKNFKWTVQLTEAMVNNVYTFAVYCDVKDGTYPAYVDFTITYMGEYIVDPTVAKLMQAEEANFITPKGIGKYINADGGVGNYYNSNNNKTHRLDGSNFKYNEETGYYHKLNEDGTFGPILCAAITTPCAFYEESLDKIESHGNKDLTVSSGTENYKQFIEISYANACNSDGVCYVTKELKDFLQKFSVSQSLFFDGLGFCELYGGGEATDDDQWLFACGYYEFGNDENA